METPERAADRAAEAAGEPTFGSRLVRALSSRACLAAILAGAALLRIAHVMALRPLPLFDRLIIDSEVYDAWAQRIAAGDWLTEILGGPFYMDPLYPYFLGAVNCLVGRDLLLVRLLQIAMGVATCWLVARLATRLHGALAGNLAAASLAMFGPSIFQEGEFEKTALGVFLATAAIVLFLGGSWRSRLAAGAVFGLAALTRGNILCSGRSPSSTCSSVEPRATPSPSPRAPRSPSRRSRRGTSTCPGSGCSRPPAPDRTCTRGTTPRTRTGPTTPSRSPGRRPRTRKETSARRRNAARGAG
jgi:hypothetical protein